MLCAVLVAVVGKLEEVTGLRNPAIFEKDVVIHGDYDTYVGSLYLVVGRVAELPVMMRVTYYVPWKVGRVTEVCTVVDEEGCAHYYKSETFVYKAWCWKRKPMWKLDEVLTFFETTREVFTHVRKPFPI